MTTDIKHDNARFFIGTRIDDPSLVHLRIEVGHETESHSFSLSATDAHRIARKLDAAATLVEP